MFGLFKRSCEKEDELNDLRTENRKLRFDNETLRRNRIADRDHKINENMKRRHDEYRELIETVKQLKAEVEELQLVRVYNRDIVNGLLRSNALISSFANDIEALEEQLKSKKKKGK